MIRALVTKITGMIAERSHASRKKYQAPVRIRFEPIRTTGNLTASSDGLFLSGETSDLSGTGIAFVVSAIRVKEYYLVGQDRILNAEIDLPGRTVIMKVIGRRYERIGVHLSTEKYIVGAEIVEISKADRAAYDIFLQYGGKGPKPTGTMELGID
jgi:hypothetical protein